MPLLKPDPTFYPSPRLAMQAPPEKHAFVAALNPPDSKANDALLVVDVDETTDASSVANFVAAGFAEAETDGDGDVVATAGVSDDSSVPPFCGFN